MPIARQASRSRNARTCAASTSVFDERRPDPAHEDECKHSRFTFLSCAISPISASASGRPPAMSFGRGRQADLGQMADRARGFGRRQEARAAPRIRTRAPCRAPTASPCSRRSEKPAGRLQRVAEGVAEIEQRAVAGLALVARHDRGLDRGSSTAMACCARRARAAGEHRASWPPARRRMPASPSRPYLATSA